MADKKISQLTSAVLPLAGTELVPVVQSGSTVKVSAASLGAAAAYTPAGTGAVVGTVQAKLRESVSVKDFGAVGDGVTNDTAAFAAASAYITVQGGGKLVIPQGTYIVGQQTFAGATGKGYAYQASTILSFTNCTKPVVVEGNGAIIKIASGLKFGSFDPVTGNVYTPGSLPFTNADYKASIGYVISAVGCSAVTVRDLEVDGNIQNLTVGGQWGDTGRQIPAYGLYFYGNSNVLVSNVYTHHNALDGIVVGYVGLTEASQQYPHTLINVVSDYNARQGLSWVGGTQLTAIDCKFNNTGKSTFSSSPGAGVDIEAESSVCRNGMFINCEMQNNTGVGVVADSGDSADVTFLRCKIIGQTQYAIWPRKPRFSFLNCLIVGSYVNAYASSTVPQDATRFSQCVFTDESKYAATLYLIGSLGSLISATSVQTNVVYESCNFIATRAKVGRLDGSIIRNCSFDIQAGTTYCADQDFFLNVSSATLDGVSIVDNITVNIPATGFYVVVGAFSTTNYIGKNTITSASSKLKWLSAVSGYTGDFLNNQASVNELKLNYSYNNSAYGANVALRHVCASAAPTTGTWAKGDRTWNNNPTVGQPKSWVCTVAGTPGTWTSEGNL